jgi:thioredoxin-related protein
MKNLLYFLLLFVTLPAFTLKEEPTKAGNKINWMSIEEAEKLSKENPRKIFVDVYTDWCGWCKKMDKSTFSSPIVVDYVNSNYYAVKLNAESTRTINFRGVTMTEAELAGKIFKVSGYPTIVLIEKDFSNFVPVAGFQDAEDFESTLTDFNRVSKRKK